MLQGSDGTIAHYRFENGVDGQSASDPASILDSGPNGYHGDPAGDPIYTDTQCAVPNLDLNLDGSDDYLHLPGDFVFHEGFDEATVEFSIKSPATATHAAVLWTRSDGADKNRFHLFLNAGGGLGLDYREKSGALHTLVAADEGWGIDPDQWTHIAITRALNASGAHEYGFYKNGVLILAKTDGAVPAPVPDASGWTLGWRLSPPYDHTEGSIDEVRLSDRVLLPSEFTGICLDCNDNGAPDWDDIANGTSDDCNGNGRPDECEIDEDPGMDWNGDGVLDSCSTSNYCTANPNSTGAGAVIGASGSPVVSDDTFALEAWDLPLNEYGYFLTSQSTAFIPSFGGSDGNLCIGPPQYRFNDPASGGQVLNSGATGTMSLTLDFGLLPNGVNLAPGETWFFQLWFRDVFSSNTTDGIEVLFR